MAGIPTQLGGVLLADAPGVIHTVASDKRLVVKQVVLCNLDAVAHSVSLYNGAPGDPAEIDNAVVYQAVLAAGATALLPMTMVLGPGDRLLASASVAGTVSCSASGLTYDSDDEPIPLVLHRGLLGATSTPVYTSGPGITIVKHLTVCNVTLAERWVSVYLVPAADAPDDAHLVVHQRSVPPRSTLFESMTFVLGEGDSVYLSTSAADTLAAVLSGVAA